VSSLTAGSSFSSSGFASSGKLGALLAPVLAKRKPWNQEVKRWPGFLAQAGALGIEANVGTFLSPSLVYPREHVLTHPGSGPVGPVQ
jgi:hypothetical protein